MICCHVLSLSQASSCELMAVLTPTVNRERAQNGLGTATLPPLDFAAIHNSLAGGNGDSQLCQVRFTTRDPRFTT